MLDKVNATLGRVVRPLCKALCGISVEGPKQVRSKCADDGRRAELLTGVMSSSHYSPSFNLPATPVARHGQQRLNPLPTGSCEMLIKVTVA
jgi:hypothetical protein